MSNFLNILIEKLSSGEEEIRLVSLCELNSRLRREVSNNTTIRFNGSFLLKSLIQWFAHIPLKEEKTVLGLILFILSSSYGDEILETLKKDRILNELHKIEFFLRKDREHLQILNDIREVLRSKNHKKDYQKEDELKLDLSGLKLDIRATVDFVKCWDTPGVVDLNNLKQLHQALCQNSGDDDNLNNAISFLPNSIKDFPPEFFLQPPYVYKDILKLLPTKPQAINIIELFNKSLLGGIKFHQLTATYQHLDVKEGSANAFNQISVTQFVNDCFMNILSILKLSFNDYHSKVNRCLTICSQLIELALIDPHGKKESYDYILTNFCELSNFFRHVLGENETKNFLARKVYIQILDLIMKLVRRRNLFVNSAYDSNTYEINGHYDSGNFVWIKELQIALFDVSIKIVYPNLYESILKAVDTAKIKNGTILKNLLHCENFLRSAVSLLKEPELFSDEEIMDIGIKALDSLSIHESYKMVTLLIKTISNSYDKFNGNSALKNQSEKLMLKLISYPEVDLKRVIYQEIANKIKVFFNSIVSGEKNLKKQKVDTNKLEQFCNIGVPITKEILLEVICIGYYHNDSQIHSASEAILTLIVKGRNVIGSYWKVLKDVLIPILPLLQSIANTYSSLGKCILELFDPDTKELHEKDLILGNIRFLFNEDDLVRHEALIRLLYIVDSNLLACDYTPNVKVTAESISNQICILEPPIDLEKKFCENGDYDEPVIYSLIDLLREDKIDQSVRKSALMQLNSMAENPKILNLLHELDVWFLVLAAIDNSLKIDPDIDLPETAIPAINLFTKFCIQFPDLRSELAKEVNIFLLLLRGLFKYQNSIYLHSDCVISLFLLSFNEFIEGSKNVSVPLVFSKLKLPFVGKSYHWIESPFYEMSSFEEALLSIKTDNTHQTARTDHLSLYEFKLNLGSKTNMSTDLKTPKLESLLERETLWQYIRIIFAVLWFDGLDNVMKTEVISYELKERTSLDFNENLKLIKNDLTLLGCTSDSRAFNHCVSKIQYGIQHSDIVDSLLLLDCVLKLNENTKINFTGLLKYLDRFCVTLPYIESDEVLYGHVLDFLSQSIERNYKEIINWTTKEFTQSHCNFLGLIPRNPSEKHLYEKNCNFICQFLKKLIQLKSFKTAKDVSLKLFELVTEIMAEKFNKSKLNHLKGLVNIMRTMTLIPDLFEDYPSEFVNKLINRLLLYASATKAKTQTGSYFIKLCLLTVGQLSNQINEMSMKSKHLHFVLGLAGHVDLEIRTMAWNILEKMSSLRKSAKFLVEEFEHLPGGFHACCLSTAMDDQEVDLVREVSANVFANLTSFIVVNNELTIFPKSQDHKNGGELAEDILFDIIKRHNLLPNLEQFILTFSPSEVIDISFGEKICYCGTIRAFTRIITNLININELFLDDIFHKSNVGLELINLIALVPSDVTPNTLEMAAEICKFILVALQRRTDLKEPIILTNRAVIGAILFLLNVEIFENHIFSINLWDFGVYYLALLKTIVKTPHGFQVVSQVLEHNDNGRELLNFLVLALKKEDSDEIITVSLDFLVTVFNVYQRGNWNFITLVDMMEHEMVLILKTYSENRKNVSKKNFKNENQDDCSFSKVIFRQVFRLYQLICGGKSLGQGNLRKCPKKAFTFLLLGQFLICSKSARIEAYNLKLFGSLLEELDNIFTTFGSASKDFIRKNGDTKKNFIIYELKLVLGVFTNWFSIDCLVDPDLIYDMSKCLIKLWPWLTIDYKLQLKLMTLLVHLSEDSIPVCKGLTNQYSSISHSIIQLLVHVINQEMNKVKHSQFDINLFRVSVRILINCCSSIEGRISIGKLNVLDNMDRLHPAVTKFQDPWPQITLIWINFWEIFSRYPEGSKICHMNLLFTMAKKEKFPEIRLKSLTILRNMAFVGGNRVTLLAMDDYLEAMKSCLKVGAKEDLNIGTTVIWKLIANNYKAKNKIKNTTIPYLLTVIQKELSLYIELEENYDEILVIINIICNILES